MRSRSFPRGAGGSSARIQPETRDGPGESPGLGALTQDQLAWYAAEPWPLESRPALNAVRPLLAPLIPRESWRMQAVGIRGAAWYLGGFLMLALGVALITGGGVGILLLAIPPLAVGAWVIFNRRWARAIGMTVAFGYTAMVGYVATTPWRGVTPPPGQERGPLEPTLVGLTIAFLVAGLLIALGKRGTRTDRT